MKYLKLWVWPKIWVHFYFTNYKSRRNKSGHRFETTFTLPTIKPEEIKADMTTHFKDMGHSGTNRPLPTIKVEKIEVVSDLRLLLL